MQLKSYLKQKKIRVSAIARSCNIPYSTVSEIINGKIDIDRVQIGTGRRIADACGLFFEDFYKMCKRSYEIPKINNGEILMKNKAYYLKFNFSDASGEVYLCKINDINTHFIEDMAEWTLKSIQDDIEMQKVKNEVEEWEYSSI